MTLAETASAQGQSATPLRAEVMVGVPSHNHINTIALVLRAAHTGLREHFASHTTVVVNSDAGSTDGTRERVDKLSAELPGLVQLDSQPKPTGTSPSLHTDDGALRTLLQTAHQSGAHAFLLLDPSLRGVSPDWIERLASPIVDDKFDFVASVHARRRFEGALTSGIVYPLTRALYGKRVREPIGSAFALSARLVERFVAKGVWSIDVRRMATDARAAIEAMCGDFLVAQAFVGPAEHVGADPTLDLSSLLAQALSSVFEEMNRNVSVWQRVRSSQPVPWFGAPMDAAADPPAIDTKDLLDSFHLACRSLLDVWSVVLPPASLLELKYLGQKTAQSFVMPDRLWARIVYDFALGYRLSTMNRTHLLHAMTPLYLGWLCSFVLEMGHASQDAVEDRIQQLALAFETEKPYLIARWRWPDRFNP